MKGEKRGIRTGKVRTVVRGVHCMYSIRADGGHPTQISKSRTRGYGHYSQDPRSEHKDQSQLNLVLQLQFHDYRNRDDHQQDISDDVERGVNVEEHLRVETLRIKNGVMVPGAANGGAVEEVDECGGGGGEGDVADCAKTDFSVDWVGGEAEVEDEHGELGDGVADAAENGGGEAELVVG